MKVYMTLEIFNQLKTQSHRQRSEPLSERLKRLKKLEAWIDKNEHQIEQALSKDFNKPALETQLTEILIVKNELNLFIKNCELWAQNKKVKTPITLSGHSSYIRFEPKGVILIIAPWNYPFQLCLLPLIAALAAGNTAVIKPSELTPHTSTLIENMMKELFKSNEVHVCQGDKSVTTQLLTYSFDHVFFTGSTAVGRIIAESCAKKLIPYTLELGGKCPVIINNDADSDDVAHKVFWGKFLNRGQTCVAPDLVFIHTDIFSEVQQKLNSYVAQSAVISDLHIKPASIINTHHTERLNTYLKQPINFDQQSVQFIDITKENFNQKLLEEEIFGPISPLIPFTTLNDIKKYFKPDPLALYVFSDNDDFIQSVINEFPSGDVGINTLITHLANHHLPFGGIRSSGSGQYHGYYGFIEFSHQRSVIKHWGFKALFRELLPPYSKKTETLVKVLKKIK